METEQQLIGSKNKETPPLHQCAHEMSGEEPTCVLHLEVVKSEDMEIIQRPVLINSDIIKREKLTDTCLKQKLLQDAGRDGLINGSDIKQVMLQVGGRDGLMNIMDMKEEKVEGLMDIENNELSVKINIKNEPLHKVDVESDKLINLNDIKCEEEDLNIQNDGIAVMDVQKQEFEVVCGTRDVGEAAVKQEPSEEVHTPVEIEIFMGKDVKQEDLKIAENVKDAALTEKFAEDGPNCKIYPRKFAAKSNLKVHYKTHTREKPFQCEICRKRFPLNSYLLRHMHNVHTGKKSFECHICQRSFVRKGEYNRHLRRHISKIPFECDICKQKFDYKRDLIRHLRIHTVEKICGREICQQSFNQEITFNNQFEMNTNEKTFKCEICQPYKCELCQQRFTTKSHLNDHLIIHTGKKPFECKICKQTFRRKGTLNVHLRTHTGEKPYECEICLQRFSVECTLHRHLKHVHAWGKPFECNICQKRFSVKNDLNIHFRKHTLENPLECHICKKKFDYKLHLARHLRTHTTGDKLSQSDTSEQPSVNQENSINRNSEMHSDEKQCQTCHQKFTTDSFLNKHLLTHTEEKPFKCDICQQRFTTNRLLKTHLTMHTGEKPFECKICHLRFHRKCTMNMHLRTHTEKACH